MPAAVAKGLRDKPAHLDAIPLQGNTGREVQVTGKGIRVPVLDRQAVIPVRWPAPVAVVTRVEFEKQEADWFVTVYFEAGAMPSSVRQECERPDYEQPPQEIEHPAEAQPPFEEVIEPTEDRV